MHKKGHSKFREIRHDLFSGIQIFLGYPHRQHRRFGVRENPYRRNKIEEIRQKEFDYELKKADKKLFK
jgi:nitroreductase